MVRWREGILLEWVHDISPEKRNTPLNSPALTRPNKMMSRKERIAWSWRCHGQCYKKRDFPIVLGEKQFSRTYISSIGTQPRAFTWWPLGRNISEPGQACHIWRSLVVLHTCTYLMKSAISLTWNKRKWSSWATFLSKKGTNALTPRHVKQELAVMLCLTKSHHGMPPHPYTWKIKINLVVLRVFCLSIPWIHNLHGFLSQEKKTWKRN